MYHWPDPIQIEKKNVFCWLNWNAARSNSVRMHVGRNQFPIDFYIIRCANLQIQFSHKNRTAKIELSKPKWQQPKQLNKIQFRSIKALSCGQQQKSNGDFSQFQINCQPKVKRRNEWEYINTNRNDRQEKQPNKQNQMKMVNIWGQEKRKTSWSLTWSVADAFVVAGEWLIFGPAVTVSYSPSSELWDEAEAVPVLDSRFS